MNKRVWIVIEWLATISLIIGVALTSFNIYPLNIYVSVLGNLLWFFMALYWRKLSLIIIQVFILLLYVVGVVKYLIGG